MRRCYTVDELKDSLVGIFQKNGIKKAIVFGSYASGCADGQSDLDLCVETDLRGLAFISFIEEIRKKLKIDPDVVRTSDVVAGSRLEREITKGGVVIYEG